MSEWPKGVRLAGHGDEKRVLDLCVIAHAENGFGTMDMNKVAVAVQKAVDRQGAIFAIIDGPERLEAALGLQLTLPWYCKDDDENWYYSELFWYVHPLHRQSRHAAKLFRFAQWWEKKCKLPVLIGLMPRDDFAKKEKFCERFGTRVGSTFLIGRKSYSEVSGNA